MVHRRNKDERSIFAQIFFFWLDKIFIKGFKTNLNSDDLSSCPRELHSNRIYQKFHSYWQTEQKRRRPDIKIALARTLKPYLLISAIFQLLEGVLLLAQIILINYLSSCNVNTGNQTIAYIGPSIAYTLALASITISLPLIRSVLYYLMNCAGMQMRTICTTAIYKKILNVQLAVLHRVSTGHIINLVSNDVFKFDLGIQTLNSLFVSPLIVLLSIAVLLVYVGPVALLGIIYIIMHIPLQIVIGFLYGHFRHYQSKTADNRILLMDQIIRGMRVIRSYVWEKAFIEQISQIRKKEILFASLAGISQSSTFAFYDTSLFIGLFLSYSVSIVLNQPLESSQLALTFLVLSTVRLYCVFLVGFSIFGLRESVIALRRIQYILELPDTQNRPMLSSKYNSSIKMSDFSASWKENDKIVLSCINLTIDHPQLVVIAGPIGSGKSSLLLSLINELPGLSGDLCITGKSAYCSQVPWIFSGSVRDNILFGNIFDSERYWSVLNACSLKEDVDSLQDGDMTLIGERGMTLSGGQKARVSLARSVYHRADIYLLDDPLSAVDPQVGREIFNNCIQHFLKDKIVILVTHQNQYLQNADLVVIMSEGAVVSSGTYRYVIENELDFIKGLEKKKGDEDKFEKRNIFSINENSVEITEDIELNPATSDLAVERDGDQPHTHTLSTPLTDEDDGGSSVRILTYCRYFWAGGLLASLFIIILTILSNGALIISYRWMQSLATCIVIRNGTNLTSFYQACPWYLYFDTNLTLSLLALLTLSGAIFVFLRGFSFYYVLLQASRRLHNRMLHRLLRTPMRFFDTNPSGRILNRFSKDIGFLDEQLPTVFYDFWQNFTHNIAVAIAICTAQYIMIVPFFILTISTLSLRFYYLRSSTQIKRMESIARSPLYSHFSLTLQGISTIRALGIESRVIQDFHFLQDEHSRVWYHYIAGERWFGMRIDLLATLTIEFGIFSVFVSHCIFDQGELINFSFPLLFSIVYSFYYLVKLSGHVEIFMVSVDRILKYSELPQERITDCDSPNPPPQRLDTGKIEYENICFKYSDELPYVLRNICLTIFPGEKIGIIGRTGAGKSSLFNSLLRINENSSGRITVDSQDIQSLNLYEHRNRISVIPQDPFLFSGTLSFNLDPFSQFSTEEVWDALSKSHMRGRVECLPGQLGAKVEEDGFNFSTGERQLLCLARAILTRNKIILIDEATANVDLHTDQLIQQVIRSHFSDCSLLTIAHRIETIINSDRIVVLENGGIIDTGAPSTMLLDENSYLSKLLAQLDPGTQVNLRRFAKTLTQ